MTKAVTYTAPNGQTRTSRSAKMVYTHAVAIFNISQPWITPKVVSWHSSEKLAAQASRQWLKPRNDGSVYRVTIVPVTSSLLDDMPEMVEWAQQIASLRTQKDIDVIPLRRVELLERNVADHAQRLAEYQAYVDGDKTDEYVSMDDLVRYRDEQAEVLAEAQETLRFAREEYEATLPPAPVAPEETVPSKPGRKAQRSTKARFIKELADVIRGEGGEDEPQPVSQGRTMGTGHLVTIERDADGTGKALIIKNEQGNFFEFRCPFSSRNAGIIAAQVWALMRSLGL